MRIFIVLLATFSLSYVSASAEVDYESEVKPFLHERCYACHGVLRQEGGLRLDTAQFAFQGGDSGPALVAGDAQASLILERVTADVDLRMPPEGLPLKAHEIELLRQWIQAGANAPSDEQPQTDPQQHWAFQPPRSALTMAVPVESDRFNVVDFLLTRHHQRLGLTAAPRATRERLLRRVYLDLIGLPPTQQQLTDFLEDDSPHAYARVVDRLLESPHYGERWGRHWMDVWRYSDWSGEENNQVRGAPQHIWRWRDWTIDALNADIGYDNMIRLMLAADEVAPQDQSQLRATGFLARNWYRFNRNVWLEDTVEHTAKAFLGLTFNCAKCHDHKYDPISQENYYQFRAFFEPHDIRTDPVNGESDTKKDGLVRVYDAHPDAPTYLFERGLETQPVESNPLSPELPSVLKGNLRIQPVALQVQQEKEMEGPASSTGRRLALANWIVDRNNPLTARVAVNHVWLRLFGQPLVENMTDFGLRTPVPEFADLLDTLAVQFMESGWSLKSLQRTILLSDAYCMDSSFASAQNRRKDPDNHLLWRMNSRRMEGEVIRDSVLYLAGNLEHAIGGPEVPLEERETSRRRSLYFRHGHERQVPFLKTFDGASVLECYRRDMTVVPQQALALANDLVIREQSRIIATQLASLSPDRTDFIGDAFLHVLCRTASAQEVAACLKFLTDQAVLVAAGELTYADDSPPARVPPAADPELRARQSLVHVLLNHNDFVTVR